MATMSGNDWSDRMQSDRGCLQNLDPVTAQSGPVMIQS